MCDSRKIERIEYARVAYLPPANSDEVHVTVILWCTGNGTMRITIRYATHYRLNYILPILKCIYIRARFASAEFLRYAPSR